MIEIFFCICYGFLSAWYLIDIKGKERISNLRFRFHAYVGILAGVYGIIHLFIKLVLWAI